MQFRLAYTELAMRWTVTKCIDLLFPKTEFIFGYRRRPSSSCSNSIHGIRYTFILNSTPSTLLPNKDAEQTAVFF